MNILTRFTGLMLGLLIALSTLGQFKKTQEFFPVESTSGEAFDSLFDLFSDRKWDLLESQMETCRKMPLETTADSMGFFLSMGVASRLLEEYDSGAYYLNKGRILGVRLKNEIYLGAILNSLGNLHYFLQDEEKAFDLYVEATQLNLSKKTLLAMHHNIGVIFHSRYERAKGNKSYQDSVAPLIDASFRKCISLEEEVKDYINLAGTYSVLVPWYAVRGMYDSAYYFGEQCLQLCNVHGFDDRKAFLSINIGKALIMQGRFQEGYDTIQFAVNRYEFINDIEQTIHAISVQTWALDSMGRFEESKSVHRRMFNLERSKAKEKLAKSISEYENRFETQQQRLKTQILEGEIAKEQFRLNRSLLIIGLLIVSIVGGVFFYRNRLKQKEVLLQSQKINHQRELIQVNMESEERERQRIARELHDGVGQQIAGIKMSLNHFNDSTSEVLSGLKELVNETLQSVRGLSHQMVPISLQQHGLVKALEHLTEFMNENGIVQYQFTAMVNTPIALNDTAEIHVYRIAQELLNNIEKHSKGSTAIIQCFNNNEHFLMTISDDGIGIRESKSQGIGLSNIQSRSEAIRADLRIESTSDGTEVLLKVPYE